MECKLLSLRKTCVLPVMSIDVAFKWLKLKIEHRRIGLTFKFMKADC